MFDNGVLSFETTCHTIDNEVNIIQRERTHDNSAISERWVRREWPPNGAVKLNVDGSSRGNPGLAGYGGIIRGDQGQWIVGFQGSLGTASNLKEELMALCQGLRLAWSRGYRYVMCESDSTEVTRLIQSTVDVHHLHHAILADIQEYIHREWQMSICHVMREANNCADFLARAGLSQQDRDFVIWEEPPAALRPLLRADYMGTCFLRF